MTNFFFFFLFLRRRRGIMLCSARVLGQRSRVCFFNKIIYFPGSVASSAGFCFFSFRKPRRGNRTHYNNATPYVGFAVDGIMHNGFAVTLHIVTMCFSASCYYRIGLFPLSIVGRRRRHAISRKRLYCAI